MFTLPPKRGTTRKQKLIKKAELLNSWPGDLSAGECGVGIFPEKCEEFRTKLELNLQSAHIATESKM